MALFNRSRRRQTGRPASMSDVLCEELLRDPNVDVNELNDLLHDPSALRVPEPVELEDEYYDDYVPEGMLARAARITALVVAVGLLCGSVVAASMLHRQRSDDRLTAVSDVRPAAITGVRALVEFSQGALEVPKPSVNGPAPRSDSAAPRTTGTPRSDDNGAGDEVSSAARTGSGHDGPFAAARKFYRQIVGDPAGAMRMLDADLSEQDAGDLVRAWQTVSDVRVSDLAMRPDGMVRSVVLITRSDGERYRVAQLLRIVDEGSPAITEVRLLSSQRTAVGS